MRENQFVNDFYLRLLKIFQSSDEIVYRYYQQQRTYSEMYAQMKRFNRALSAYKNAQVVLYGSKAFETYSAIYSILLSHNTWIPLSLDNPHGRNLEILNQCSPALFLYEGALPEEFRNYCAGKGIKAVSYSEALRGPDVDFSTGNFGNDDAAYIMFTSGSTGVPKGVPMTHANYIPFVNNVMSILPFGKKEVFSDFHDFAFDISIFYLFAAPLAQAALSPIMEQKDKVIPLNHIMENKITVWSSTPSVINRIKTFRPNDKFSTTIKVMFLCGEPLKFDVLCYCFENMQLENVYNFYGLTETGVENFYHRCLPSDLETYVNFGVAPIGKPLNGNAVMVTDERELWIGGCQVTSGYLAGRSPEKFTELNGIRWCKTGDIVDKFEDIYFCKGRMDSQVKISGHRIELMDIEAHIAKQPEVAQVVCFAVEKNDVKNIIAAVKYKNAVEFKEIQQRLQKDLPNYMIPKAAMVLEEFPVNVNGKVDRKKLVEWFLSPSKK